MSLEMTSTFMNGQLKSKVIILEHILEKNEHLEHKIWENKWETD
jgi:hypothetical protein